jgi:hypothetical protein
MWENDIQDKIAAPKTYFFKITDVLIEKRTYILYHHLVVVWCIIKVSLDISNHAAF